MAQFARPDSDVSAGSWTAQGGPSSLYDCINEVTASDSDYCEEAGGTTKFEVGLSNVSDPAIGTGHIVRWRWNTDGGGAREKATIRLRQGATTNIATMVLNQNIDRGWTDRSYTLTEAEANSITDYDDLRLDFTINQQGAGENCWISWAELEIPDAGYADLVAESKTFTLTGQTTGLTASRLLTAAQGGPFTLTGQAAGLAAARVLLAAQGSFTLTGQDAGFAASRLLTAGQGSFVLTGQDAGLAKTFTMIAAQGSFTLTGQDAGLSRTRVLLAAQGSFAFTGYDAILTCRIQDIHIDGSDHRVDSQQVVDSSPRGTIYIDRSGSRVGSSQGFVGSPRLIHIDRARCRVEQDQGFVGSPRQFCIYGL
jgi:hypothetical protein